MLKINIYVRRYIKLFIRNHKLSDNFDFLTDKKSTPQTNSSHGPPIEKQCRVQLGTQNFYCFFHISASIHKSIHKHICTKQRFPQDQLLSSTWNAIGRKPTGKFQTVYTLGCAVSSVGWELWTWTDIQSSKFLQDTRGHGSCSTKLSVVHMITHYVKNVWNFISIFDTPMNM